MIPAIAAKSQPSVEPENALPPCGIFQLHPPAPEENESIGRDRRGIPHVDPGGFHPFVVYQILGRDLRQGPRGHARRMQRHIFGLAPPLFPSPQFGIGLPLSFSLLPAFVGIFHRDHLGKERGRQQRLEDGLRVLVLRFVVRLCPGGVLVLLLLFLVGIPAGSGRGGIVRSRRAALATAFVPGEVVESAFVALPVSREGSAPAPSAIEAILDSPFESEGHSVGSVPAASERFHGAGAESGAHESGGAEELEELSLEPADGLEGLDGEEVVPTEGVAGAAEGVHLFVGVEGGQVVRVRGGEAHFGPVGFLPFGHGRLEGTAIAEGGGDGEGIVGHAEHGSEQDELADPAVHGEGGEVHSEGGHVLASVRIYLQGFQGHQLVHGAVDRFGIRGFDQSGQHLPRGPGIVQRAYPEHELLQRHPPHLRFLCRSGEVVSVSGEEVHRHPFPDPSRPSPSLARVGHGDGHVLEGAHASGGIVAVFAHASGVDNEGHVVDGDGGLGDVGGEDDLADAGRGSLEAEALVFGGDGGVQGEDPVGGPGLSEEGGAEEELLKVGDFLDAGEEDQDGGAGGVLVGVLVGVAGAGASQVGLGVFGGGQVRQPSYGVYDEIVVDGVGIDFGEILLNGLRIFPIAF
mmetsp:Transcript_16102/g.36224  ORF Transcript_16102/g.36224 Transcript_16102/m.36224 type:complete len:631 (-) Transcript_16102:848-2740(-)